MYSYVIFTISIAVLIIAGVMRRTRRSGHGNAFVQLVGGLNVFAAALLVFMTILTLFLALNNQLRLGIEFIEWSSFVFIVVISLFWIIQGLVPIETVPDNNEKLLFGHFLLIVGTVAYGSVTFFLPFLVWLGLISSSASAVLPWLAFVTFPAAVVLWIIGITLIWGAGSNNLPEGKHE